MCLIAWNWQPASATPLVLLSNRDEFYDRPALALHWWPKAPGGACVLAGKDQQAGGTWLGLSRSGRLAALTNYRSGDPARANAPSRGELVAGFVQGDMTAAHYLQSLALHTQDYNPFNLLVFDGEHLLGLESRGSRMITLPEGIGALSNADFQTPWPKLMRLKERLQGPTPHDEVDTARLLKLMQDTTLAADADLPRTGVPLELERALSAIFIATPGYGTRACSVVHLHRDRASFTEQRFGVTGLMGTEKQIFAIERPKKKRQ